VLSDDINKAIAQISAELLLDRLKSWLKLYHFLFQLSKQFSNPDVNRDTLEKIAKSFHRDHVIPTNLDVPESYRWLAAKLPNFVKFAGIDGLHRFAACAYFCKGLYSGAKPHEHNDGYVPISEIESKKAKAIYRRRHPDRLGTFTVPSFFVATTSVQLFTSITSTLSPKWMQDNVTELSEHYARHNALANTLSGTSR